MKRLHFYALMTVLVFGFLYAYTAVMVVIATLFALLKGKRVVRFMARFWARSVFWILGKRVHLTGAENLVQGGKYILISNHSSLFDIMAIMSFYPDVTWFGRERLLKVPLFGYFLRTTGYIAMKQANYRNTKEMLEQLVLKSKGQTIAIFPEGTRTLDGKINRFHKGFIHLLRTSNLDILPVTLNGLFSLKPKNRFYIDFDTKVEVVIHQPIDNKVLLAMDDDEIILTVKKIIESASVDKPEYSDLVLSHI